MKQNSQNKFIMVIGVILGLSILMTSSLYAADNSAVLKNEIAELKDKVAMLEQKLNQQNAQNQQNIPQPQYAPAFNTAVPSGMQDEWDPFAEMELMRQQMNQMFNNSFWRGQGRNNLLSQVNHFDPSADIQDSKDGYIVKLDLPGMEKGDINVEVKNNQLVISGEKKTDKEEKNQNAFYRRERSFGYFSRVIPLPADASPENVNAEYVNGILTVKIGKLADKKKDSAAQKVVVK